MTTITSHFQLHRLCYTLSPLTSSSPHCLSEVLQGLCESLTLIWIPLEYHFISYGM